MSFTPFVIVLHLAASCVLYSLKCLCDENWQLQNVQHNFVETCDFVFLVVKIIVRLVVYFVANFVLNCEDSYENVSLFQFFICSTAMHLHLLLCEFTTGRSDSWYNWSIQTLDLTMA